MVVVVPTVADADDRHEPVVHAVVFDVEVLVAPLRHVADDVQNQGAVEREETCQQAGSCYERSKSCPKGNAEEQAADDVNRIAQLPICARLEEAVERIFEQVLTLDSGVDVLRIMPFAIEGV